MTDHLRRVWNLLRHIMTGKLCIEFFDKFIASGDKR